MFKYQLTTTSKSDNQLKQTKANRITTLIKEVNSVKNVYFAITRTSDKKIVMRGSL